MANTRKWLLKSIWCLRTVRTKWVETFCTPIPKAQTFYRIRDRFDATCLIMNCHKIGRAITVCREDHKEIVPEECFHRLQISARSDSAAMAISQNTKKPTILDNNVRTYEVSFKLSSHNNHIIVFTRIVYTIFQALVFR